MGRVTGSSTPTSKLKIALVEAQDLAAARSWELPPNNYSNRASSLTPSTVSFLSQIGAWPHVDPSRIQSYHHMRVWDGLDSSASISFDSSSSEYPLAHMIENANLTRALLERIAALRPISLYDKTSVASIELGPPPTSISTINTLNLFNYPHLTLSSGHTLAARLLVGADGQNSSVRKFAGTPSRGWDYDRHGVVGTLKLAPQETHHDTATATAYQRFLPSGPIALLPLPNDYATLVWTTTPTQAAHLKSLSPSDLTAMINAAFRLEPVDINYMFTIPSGQVSELSWRESITAPNNPIDIPLPPQIQSIQPHSIASFPLRFRHADTYISSRIALVGDAAHTIHPLAGQGLNMGFGDANALADAIQDCVRHGGDIGVESNLEGYQSKVYAANARMLGVVDKLHWLYRMEGWVGVQLRGLGLKGVDRLGALKGFLMKAAGA